MDFVSEWFCPLLSVVEILLKSNSYKSFNNGEVVESFFLSYAISFYILVLTQKADEIASCKQNIISSQTIAYEKQIEVWKEKFADKKEACDTIEEKYLGSLQNEKLLQQENRLLAAELQLLKQKMEWHRTEASTQTVSDEENYGSKELLEKMNEIMDVVQNDKLTISQLDSKNSTYTQTTPHKVRFICNEKSVQTDETTDGPEAEREDGRSEKAKRKQKLNNETQRLLLLKSDLSQENRSLKKRVLSLENQVNVSKKFYQT